MPHRPPPVGADLAPIGWAASALGVSVPAIRKRVTQSGTIRGIEPHSALNPTHRWMVSVDDVLALCEQKGLPTPEAPHRLAAVTGIEAVDEDAKAGYELARESERVAKEDRDRAIISGLQREIDLLRHRISEQAGELRRLRTALRSLVEESVPEE